MQHKTLSVAFGIGAQAGAPTETGQVKPAASLSFLALLFVADSPETAGEDSLRWTCHIGLTPEMTGVDWFQRLGTGILVNHNWAF